MCAALTRCMRTLLLMAALAVAAPAFAQGSIFPDKDTKKAARQLAPSAIAEDLRPFLRGKMKNHAKEMKDLSLAVSIVDLEKAARLSQAIASEPRLDPAVGPATRLPVRFFELQDELRKRAQALADAARANEMTGTHEKYAALVENCMACHAAFKAQIQAK